MVEKLFLDPFIKNQNWAYLWINWLKFYTVCFYCMSCWGLSKYIETRLQTTCFYSYKAFLKNKKKSGTSLPALFSAWFWRKILLLLYSIPWPNFIVWLSLLRAILCICTLQLFVIQVLTSQAVFSTWPKNQDKNLNILRTKSALKMK